MQCPSTSAVAADTEAYRPKTMSPAAQHIALMESLGWEHSPTTDHAWERPWRNHALACRVAELPPLTLDLMAQAEATLPRSHHGNYADILENLIDPPPYPVGTNRLLVMCATKEQRLEAYLKTTGRWITL